MILLHSDTPSIRMMSYNNIIIQLIKVCFNLIFMLCFCPIMMKVDPKRGEDWGRAES